MDKFIIKACKKKQRNWCKKLDFSYLFPSNKKCMCVGVDDMSLVYNVLRENVWLVAHWIAVGRPWIQSYFILLDFVEQTKKIFLFIYRAIFPYAVVLKF